MFVATFLSFPQRVATLLGLLYATLISSIAAPADSLRTTFFVPIPPEGSWHDMAFLATVPAATHANRGAPSLISLAVTGDLPPEIIDYTKRYRPGKMILLDAVEGRSNRLGKSCEKIKVASADEAACRLSERFWPTSEGAVICPDDDYKAGLIASALAAHLRVPLLFTSKHHISTECVVEIKRLKVQNIVAVGPCTGGVQYLRKEEIKVTELAGGLEVLAWAKESKIPVNYLTAVNSQDREDSLVRKLSLAGVLLAAGRQGLVAPLTMQCHWRTPFGAVAMTTDLPSNIPKGECPPRSGKISISGSELTFIVTEDKDQKNPKAYIDLNGDGKYVIGKEGPFVTGDTIEVGTSRQIITLESTTAIRVAGESDLRLSGPPVSEVVSQLRKHYAALGTTPEYLCLAGFPDVIPQELGGSTNSSPDIISDLPYSNADEDPFAEICVARLVAEDVSVASLFASRVITYPSLVTPEWGAAAGQAQWENSCDELFKNVGFKPEFRHVKDDLKWKVARAKDGTGGEREGSFSQDSPLTRCSLLSHIEHSYWIELGGTYRFDGKTLIAPMVIESGGCCTAALDGDKNFKTVVPRLLRNGAVSFVGNARNGCAPNQVQRMEFWTNVLDGKTVGQAHRNSINSAMATILNDEQDLSKSYLYQVRIWTLFGDPAFRPHIPSKSKVVPAHTTVTNDIVTVHSPATWWKVKIIVPEDWKNWVGKDLYSLRGVGTYTKSNWGARQRNDEQTCYTAEFTTRRPVVEIKQLGSPPAPLGMLGKWKVDLNANGTSTYRWVVRLVDFDQETGRIIKKSDRFDYQVIFK